MFNTNTVSIIFLLSFLPFTIVFHSFYSSIFFCCDISWIYNFLNTMKHLAVGFLTSFSFFCEQMQRKFVEFLKFPCWSTIRVIIWTTFNIFRLFFAFGCNYFTHQPEFLLNISSHTRETFFTPRRLLDDWELSKYPKRVLHNFEKCLALALAALPNCWFKQSRKISFLEIENNKLQWVIKFIGKYFSSYFSQAQDRNAKAYFIQIGI